MPSIAHQCPPMPFNALGCLLWPAMPPHSSPLPHGWHLACMPVSGATSNDLPVTVTVTVTARLQLVLAAFCRELQRLMKLPTESVLAEYAELDMLRGNASPARARPACLPRSPALLARPARSPCSPALRARPACPPCVPALLAHSAPKSFPRDGARGMHACWIHACWMHACMLDGCWMHACWMDACMLDACWMHAGWTLDACMLDGCMHAGCMLDACMLDACILDACMPRSRCARLGSVRPGSTKAPRKPGST